MTRSGTAAALLLLALGAPPAGATDQPVPGRKLLLSDRAGRQRATFDARSPSIAAPEPQGSDDPTRFGATLGIVNPVSGESASFDLPAAHWSVSAGGTAYRFKNRVAPAPPSEVRIALLRSGRLKVSARACGISLDEPSQGAIAVVLTTGTHRYCASFGGRVMRDVPGRFKAASAPAPASCPGGSTTSTTATTGASTSTSASPSTTTTTAPDLGQLLSDVSPEGDADHDGFSNTLELGSCSNPADPASTPENDSSLCANAHIYSSTLGPAWGNTDNQAEPFYNAAVAALTADNAAQCSQYCATTPNLGSPEACEGAWPYTGSVEHPFYADGVTVEVNFPDEDGNRLAGNIFLPPQVTCTPSNEPGCDGVTDAVTCTAPPGETYPAVVITDGFLGAQPMYYWAAHGLARLGYITMTYDVSGQGKSQGTFPNSDADVSSDVADQSPFSRDVGAAVNFIESAANPVRGLIRVDPMLIVNQGTGATSIVEPYVLGAAGHSYGARGSITYQQSTEALYPVRVRAVVGWSHFDNPGTIGNVPIQLQTGDEDDGFIEPPGSGNIVPEQERRYDRLAGDRDLDGTPDFTPHDRQIVVIQDNTHIGWSEGPWFYYPVWSREVALHYTLAWFDKYLMGDIPRAMSDVSGGVINSVDAFNDYAACSPPQVGCYTATERLKLVHVHLSSTWCSRFDVGGDTSGNMKGGSCGTQ